MVHPCDKPCGNKTASGYCATTACINPQYSNIGTAHYGQGVQKRIITNADVWPVVRAKWIGQRADSKMCSACGVRFYISALFAVGGNNEPNFCPNCVADMRAKPPKEET